MSYKSKSIIQRLLSVLNDILSGKTVDGISRLTVSQSFLLKAITGDNNIDNYNRDQLCAICISLLEQLNKNTNAMFILEDKDYRTCSIFGDDVLVTLINKALDSSKSTFLLRNLELLLLSKSDYNNKIVNYSVAQKLVELDKNSVINILSSISDTSPIETPYRTYTEVSNIVDLMKVVNDNDFILFLSKDVVFIFFADINGNGTGVKVFLHDKRIVGNVPCADDKEEVTLEELGAYIDIYYEE